MTRPRNKSAEVLVTFALIFMGVLGTIYFYIERSTFMIVVSLLLMFAGVGLAIITFDKEWGNPFEALRPKNPNLRVGGSRKERAYVRVQNTVNNRKIFVSVEEDGIYIRLAGDENHGEAYSDRKVKVYDYEA